MRGIGTEEFLFQELHLLANIHLKLPPKNILFIYCGLETNFLF